MRKSRAGRVLVVVGALAATLSSCRQIVGINPHHNCGDPLLIDDLEDGDGEICKTSGRNGVWLTIGDGTPTPPAVLSPAQGEIFKPSPIPGGRGASNYAARFAGSGFTDWGALMIFDFKEDLGAASQTYSATPTGGLTFWMKSNAAVTISLTTPDTIQEMRGGSCVDGVGIWNCFNDFQFRIDTPPTDDWVQYKIPFLSLAQQSTDSHRDPSVGTSTLNSSRIQECQFAVDRDVNFDVWVDDIAFYYCQANACLPTCPDSAPRSCPAVGLSPARCWPAGTNCSSIPNCTEASAPIGCAATADSPAGCGRVGTDCSAVRYFDVWGTGPNHVWAVGVRGTIVHWDGLKLSMMDSGTSQDLVDVWASAGSGVWAVGLGGTILHWDNSRWSAQISGTKQNLEGIWASTPSDAWAVGVAGAILHWDGATWSPIASGTTKNLWGVWGSGPTDVWAVGVEGTILHWNGEAWSPPAASGTTSVLISVWGTAADDVRAVGFDGTIVHWNGTVWSSDDSGTTRILGHVWGDAPNDLWVAGDQTLLHWDGSRWSPDEFAATRVLTSVWGSGPDDIWVVGDGSTILHWDGSSWTERRP